MNTVFALRRDPRCKEQDPVTYIVEIKQTDTANQTFMVLGRGGGQVDVSQLLLLRIRESRCCAFFIQARSASERF